MYFMFKNRLPNYTNYFQELKYFFENYEKNRAAFEQYQFSIPHANFWMLLIMYPLPTHLTKAIKVTLRL